MTGTRTFGSIFLEYTRGTAPGGLGTVEELERRLQSMLALGQAVWPALSLAGPLFVRHLAERMEEGEDCASALKLLRVQDLYLACACVHRVPGAIEAFERRVMAQVPAALARYCASDAFVDDVLQGLREKLFVATGAVMPKMAMYPGRGPLLSWVKIAAVWHASTLRRQWDNRRASTTDRDLAREMLNVDHSAETDFFVNWYRDDFKAACAEAILSLTADQRNLLRFHYFDGLSETALAAMAGVNKSTISRRVHGAREQIWEETYRLLQEQLSLTESEFKSLAVVLQSELPLSILRLLREDPPDR